MEFFDTMTLDTTPRLTADGYLVATAKVARSGIQEYLPQELGTTGSRPLRLYRPADEVFSSATLQTFAHRPMTNGHPKESVTAKNWRKLAVGYTGDTVAKDGDFIRVPLTLMDGAVIADYQAGKRELSAGYSADIDWTPGITDGGEKYDAVMRNIRNNHIALVDSARAGHGARIGDTGTPSPAGGDGGHLMADTRKVVVDGLTIETTEQGAQVIERQTKALADAAAKLKEVTDAKDKDLAKRDAEIADLKKKVMDAAALDKAIIERADLIATARKIADVDYKGKTLADIRKAAVAAKLGDSAVADKSEAYIEARFDVLKESVSDSSTHETQHNIGDAEVQARKAREDYVARMFNGGKAVKEA